MSDNDKILKEIYNFHAGNKWYWNNSKWQNAYMKAKYGFMPKDIILN